MDAVEAEVRANKQGSQGHTSHNALWDTLNAPPQEQQSSLGQPYNLAHSLISALGNGSFLASLRVSSC